MIVRNIILTILSVVFLIQCRPSDRLLHGSWKSVIVDMTGMDMRDVTKFNKDGTCSLSFYTNSDLLVDQFTGTYSVDKDLLTITTNGYTVTHTIENITRDTLTILSQEQHKMKMVHIDKIANEGK